MADPPPARRPEAQRMRVNLHALLGYAIDAFLGILLGTGATVLLR